ncbi:hypothetical protein PHISCL_07930 [Aspergillus sclerotialis]|uniref:Autophagy-related protein 29 n=1 Tax=Aspergillus sclerotialis TaxID=2070753 RepID=A0A3A2Z9C9_9EURO|nr:hypothetical protein PHISCL_07930 [Aspergillus sclerotialis]
MAHQNQPDSQFTVFIRLPFPRGDFVDPPPASSANADKFDVTLQFLLQQAAWLYDRQLSQVRAQMRKVPVAASQSNSPSPAPGSVSGSTALAGQAKAAPSTATGSRRTSSSTLIHQARGSKPPSRNETPTAEVKEPRWDTYGRRPSTNRREQPSSHLRHRSPTLEEEEDSSPESDSDEEDDMDTRKTPRFKRFGKFSTQRPGLRDDEDEDDDDSPAFLPLSREPAQSPHDSPAQDLNATLRLDSEQPGPQRRRTSEQHPSKKSITTESSASSASSGMPGTMPESEERRRRSNFPEGLSPRAAELARASPRRSATSGKSASDDTPSMGSSFSDLDDASVTQSALEEALMSNMQHGGMASRMSTISQALRSRYL